MNPRTATERLTVLSVIAMLLVGLWLGSAGAQDAPKPSEKRPEPKAGQFPAPAPAPAVPPEAAGTPDAKPSDQPSKPEVKVVVSPILTAKLALMTDPRLFPYDIQVEANGDALVLKGKVPSKEHKAAAAGIVGELGKSVTNHLEVDKEFDREIARRRDEAITHYVKDRFSRSKTLETAGFGVKTEDGVVSLTGKTRFQVIVLEAAEAARQVPGVKAVKTDGVRLESD